MKRIDFAPRSLRRAMALTAPLNWISGAAALAFCAAIACQAFIAVDQARMRHADLERLQLELVERRAKIVPPKQWTIAAEQATAINKAIAQLNLPWRDLLDAVELATPNSIALLSLEPDAAKSMLTGTAEAKTAEEMISYVEQLKRSTFFDGVVMLRHEINDQDPNKPLRFQFEAHWSVSSP